MKKFVALLLCCLVTLCCTPFAVASAQPSGFLSLEDSAEVEAKIQTLYDERMEAQFAGDEESVEAITKELASYGVEEVTYSEIQDLLDLPSTRYVIDYENYRYERYSLDTEYNGNIWTYMVINLTPKNELCALWQTSSKKSFLPVSVQIGNFTFWEIVSRFIGSVDRYNIIETVYDALSLIFEDLIPTMTVKNLSIEYQWNLAETCSFVYLASNTVPGIYTLVGRYNKVDGEIGYTYYGADFDEATGTPIPTLSSHFYPVHLSADNFASGYYALRYWLEGNGIFEQRTTAINISGIDGSTFSVDLLNPMLPGGVS